MQQQRGDRVGHHRALHGQHAAALAHGAPHVEPRAEVGRVGERDLEEDDRILGGDVVLDPLLALLEAEGVVRDRVVRHQLDVAAAVVRQEALRRGVEGDAGGAQLERAAHPGAEGDDDDRQDEQRGDPHAVGPLDDVDDRGVDEHHGDHAETDDRGHRLRRRTAERVTATDAEVISTSTPVA